MMDTLIETPAEEVDLSTLALVEGYQKMSPEELLADILRHEKEHRGIDWLGLCGQGAEGQAEARRLARQHICQLCDGLGSAEVPETTSLYLAASASDDGVHPMPAWAINFTEANKWRQASGEVLGDMVLHRLKIMQALEVTSSSAGWATLMTSIGVLAWMKRGYDLYKVARLSGMPELTAVAKSIKGMSVTASRVYLATVIVAVIAVIILYVMEKEAAVYMALLNLTDDPLELQDLTVTHGKQTVQFEESRETRKALPPRERIEGLGPEDDTYWLGLFCAQKKDLALYGTRGAFSLKPGGRVFPHQLFVGWEVPLTGVFGGPNRCLASAHFKGGVEAFSDHTNKYGALDSRSQAGSGLVRARMHSGKGSRGYMSVIFDTV